MFNSLLSIIHKHKGTGHDPQAWVTQANSFVPDYKHRKSTIYSAYLTEVMFITQTVPYSYHSIFWYNV